MNTLAIFSLLSLFVITSGLILSPTAYADHSTASVSVPVGTSVPGCEETNECYIPADVSIDIGGEITWTNDDTAAHTVTSGSPEAGPDGFFDSSLFMAGSTFSVKFDGFESGDYPYFCMVHPWMVGTVTVLGEAMAEEHDDDKMMMDDDMMMMDGDGSGVRWLSDGTEVEIWASTPKAGEMMELKIEFDDSEHVNYDVMVTQNGKTVLNDMGAHEHAGMGKHMTAPLDSGDPVDVTITFQGYGVNDPKTGPIGEEVVITNVVPEFGTIAVMILAVAIVSIIAVSARSRLSLTPRI